MTTNKELYKAALENNADLIKELLERGAEPNYQNKCMSTALHFAVRRNKPEAVRVLLQAGADIHIRDSTGRSSYDYAILFENEDRGRSAIAQLIRSA